MNKRVFISRNPEQLTHLKEFLREKDIALDALSLIRRENVPFALPVPDTDWIFFSSPYGVESFYSQGGTSKAKLAAVGQGTAQALAPFGKITFSGIGTNTERTGKNFNEIAKGQTVLFPIAEGSLRTVEKQLDPGLCTELVCYRSVEVPISVEPADAYFLTSPSNVRSFFRANPLPENAVFLCPGESTAKTLREFGVEKIAICPDFGPSEWQNAIISALRS